MQYRLLESLIPSWVLWFLRETSGDAPLAELSYHAAFKSKLCSMDIIYLNDLKIETVIGIYDWEREMRQTVILDMEMAGDVARAAASDAIEDTINYKAVSKRLIDFIEASSFQLVETLAEESARIILEEFGVPWVRLKVNKQGAVRYAGDVGVIIERGVRPA